MEPVEYTIRVSAALDAALHRRARATVVSLDQAVIDLLSAGLEVATGDDREPPDHPADDAAPAAGLEQDALDEGVWL